VFFFLWFQCAEEHGVRWKLVAECAAGVEGDELLKHHGDVTNALHPRVSFIPTILLDQVILRQVMYTYAKNHFFYMGPSISHGDYVFFAWSMEVWEVGKCSTFVHI
jgi:hypothetical protein